MSRLFGMLEEQTVLQPDRIAITQGDASWTYTQLLENAHRLASAMAERHGIQPGDRVALLFYNQFEVLVSYFAILLAGGVVVPVNLLAPPEDIAFALMNSGTKLMLTAADIAPKLDILPIPKLVAGQGDEAKYPSFEEALTSGQYPFTPPQYDALNAMRILMYTSGTTGQPKGVMLSEENLCANLEGVDQVFHFTEKDSMVLAIPLFHAFGMTITLYGLSKGARIVLVPNFTPKKIVDALVHEQVTVLPLVPTMYSLVLERAKQLPPDSLSNLRICISGGASLPKALLEKCEQALQVTILEGYGMTETSPVLAVNRPEVGSIPGSVGPMLPNVQVQIVDGQDNPIPWQMGQASGEGEIWVKGANVMLGYYNLPDETAKVMTPDGWLKTGDLGCLDEKGNLFISAGRKKDLIIKAGENIAPIKIEQALYHHPAVQEASVIGIPDEKLGERIVACIQFREGQSATEQELKQFCRQHLPASLVPDEYTFHEALPKNPTGKIIKKALRDAYLERQVATSV